MIHVFQRHCVFGPNSPSWDKQQTRPKWFDREKNFNNLQRTISSDAALTVIFDGDPNDHFISNYDVDIKTISAGRENLAFHAMLEHVESLNLNDDDIVYFLEDDYIHKPGWCDILTEGFTVGGEYVTLFDHGDKYFLPQYSKLQSKIMHSKSIHWRTTPSTTNTYAMKYSTLIRDMHIHKRACDIHTPGSGGYDHLKFVKLWEMDSNLISCIPGFSTTIDTCVLSPTVDWEQYL